MSRVAQSVQCLTMNWPTGVASPTEAEYTASRPALEPPSLLYNGEGRGPFLGGKELPGHDADHTSPASAEVKGEKLYLLSSQVPPWRVAGSLYFTYDVF
jgi:hypothetical protein